MADSLTMHRDSEAEDTEFLEAGDIAALLAKYEPVIAGRCAARLRGGLDAEDVAQNVKLRLLAEFHRGKRYGETPYRVVVHQVIGWTLKDYFAGRPTDAPLPEGWESMHAVEDPEPAGDLRSLFEELPPRQREVLTLRYIDGLEYDEIASRLEINPNAVYQALHNGHTKLRPLLG